QEVSCIEDRFSEEKPRMWYDDALLKRSMWLADLLLILLLVVLGADIVQSYRRVQPAAPLSPAQAPPSPLPQRQPPLTLAEYQQIVARNLFNAQPFQELPAPPAPEEGPPPSSPTLPGPLKLAGIVASTTLPQYAIIEDLSRQSAQAVYEIGDSIQ